MFPSPACPLLCLCVTIASTVPAWSQAPTPPSTLSPRIVIIGPDGKEHLIDASSLTEGTEQPASGHPPGLVWPNRAAIGVVARELPEGIADHLGLEPGQGVIIGRTFEDSPAAKAGIQQHDIIIQIGEEAVKSPLELQRLVQQSEGKAIDITWLHQGKKQTGKVTPVRGTELQAMQHHELEFMLKDLTDSLQEQALSGLNAPGILLQPEQPQRMDALPDVHSKLTQIEERMAKVEELLQRIHNSLKQD